MFEGGGYDLNLLRILTIINQYDPDLLTHCINTEKYVKGILSNLNLVNQDLCIAAVLHDIGKIYIPKELLHKPAKLDYIERAVIDMHSYYGYLFLKENGFSECLSKYVLFHHSKKKQWISLIDCELTEEEKFYVDVLRAADIYDAMVSSRPYREKVSSEAAFYILSKEKINDDILKALEKYTKEI